MLLNTRFSPTMSLLFVVHAVVACAPATPLCGEGTRLEGAVCVADEAIVCGAGTAEVDGACLPTADVCDDSLVFVDGRCQPPSPSADLDAFLSRNDLVVAAYSTSYGFASGVEHTFRFTATELSEISASAWTNAETPMVGDGLALHLGGRIFSGDTSNDVAGQINDDTGPDGACRADVIPTAGAERSDREIHLGLFRWVGGVATPVACAKVGSVIFQQSPRAVAISAQFGDGTIVEDTLPMPCDSCD